MGESSMLKAADVNHQFATGNNFSAEYQAGNTARAQYSPGNRTRSQYLPRQTTRIEFANKTLPIVAWVAMLFMPLIGVILAYVDRSKTSEIYATHYRYLIRTFWIVLLLAVIGGCLSAIAAFLSMLSVVLPVMALALVPMALAPFAMIAVGIWYLVRCVKGLVLLSRDEPIQHPGTWFV